MREGRYFDTPKDWTVIRSRKGFPWNSCTFKNYTARECFLQANELIQTKDQFLTKVITEKYLVKFESFQRKIEKSK